jgi:nucleoid DNA-binding protein
MAVKKKTASKKVTAKKAPPAVASKQTKSQVVQSIADSTGLTKKDVAAVLAAMGDLVVGHMRKRGSGEFQIPETGVKIRRVRKPARKARMGRNPATGEEIKIAAKPASTTVRVTALKSLKESVKS